MLGRLSEDHDDPLLRLPKEYPLLTSEPTRNILKRILASIQRNVIIVRYFSQKST